MPAPRTLSQKVWDAHVVSQRPGEPDLLFIDLHLVHEVTSPQAFDGIRVEGRTVRHPELTLATEDHNVPTADTHLEIADAVSRKQVETLRANCAEFAITIHPMNTPGQGIVHIIGPEQGYTMPGMTIVCGDSHTSTHGAFGALAFGIGTSEVEHVLATQTLPQSPAKTLAITVDGDLPVGSTAKDVILAILGRIGTGGGIGHIAEYRGSAIEALSMEGRMTVCNMSIEAGAKAGLIGPDQTTFDYLKGREHAPTDADWDDAVTHWRTLTTDPDAAFDTEVRLDAARSPTVSLSGFMARHIEQPGSRQSKPAAVKIRSRPSSKRWRVKSSIGKVTSMPSAGAETVLRSTSMVISTSGSAVTAAMSWAPTSSSTTTGTRPALVALLRKMSPKRGEITARNP